MKIDLRHWMAALVLLAAGFAAYGNALHNPFEIDDHAFFDEKLRNIRFIGYQFLPDKEKALNLEGGKADSYYRPLAHVIPMLCCLAFGDDTFGYHVVNLLLFVLAAFAVFWFIVFVVGDRWLALLAALLYLVHPINGVVVNYITANVFSAQVIFMLLSLRFFLGIPSRLPHTTYHLPLALFFFLLAIMCHETAMALPLYAACLLVFTQGEKWPRALARAWPYWVALGAYLVFRSNHASLNDSIFRKFAMFHMSPFEYVASLAKLMVLYLGKLIYPTGIVLIWAIPVVREYVLGWCLVFVSLLALGLGLLVYHRGQKPSQWGLAWFIVGFGPFALAALFQPVHGPMIEPHWFFFSVIGFFMFLAWLTVRAWRRWGKAVIVGVLVVVMSWSLLCRGYNWLWSEERQYCRYWLNESPGFSAVMFYLAKAYELHHQYPQARYYYELSLRKEYKKGITYTNLGLIDLMEGKWDLARTHLREAVRYDDHFSVALSNLGILYFKDGDLDQAAQYFTRAIKTNPFLILPRLNMARVFEKQGKAREALQAYRDILAIVPNHEIAMVSLTKMVVALKDQEGTLWAARQLAAHSHNPESLTNAGILLAFSGFQQEALQAFRKSIAVEPRYKEAYLQAGILCARLKQLARAADFWRRGLEVDPLDNRFKALLE